MNPYARRLTLATRRSALALTQARAWAATLCAARPEVTLEELQVVTTGDRITDKPLQNIGGKGLFLKEIEEALLEKRAHLAVHSVKDIPALLAPGLVLAATPQREDPRDALISKTGCVLSELPLRSRVGTSSLRRTVLLKAIRPDLAITPLRGNVDTRLRKLDSGEWDAIVLAYAGLKRLGLEARATELLDPSVMIPAVGQGALGIECRADDRATIALVRATHHEETSIAIACERGVMLAVEGSCQVPVAAYATRLGERIHVRAMLANPDGSRMRIAQEHTRWPIDETEATELGIRIGERLKD